MPSKRRRSREALDQEGSGSVALSFLDIVSAGFGGAIFLLVIFATLPIAERHGGGGGGSRFIDLYLEWSRVSFDGYQVEALVELQIKHTVNGSSRRFRLGKQGAEIVPQTDVFSPGDAKPPWRTALVTGYDRGGAYVPTEDLDKEGSNRPPRYLHARIIEPDDGEWSFFANLYRYQCFGNARGRISATHCKPKTRTLKVTGELLCSSGNGVQIEQNINGKPYSSPDKLVSKEGEPMSCRFTESE